MVEIDKWVGDFLHALEETFGGRVWFAGLQGSYGRGEATESSDIDTVVILDSISPEDIKVYRRMLDGLPSRELICGFFGGKNELLNWEPFDLFQFYYDTSPLKGSLDKLLCKIDEESVKRAANAGLCNIYHGCVHNMLHERSNDILKGLYKSAYFAVQALVYRQTGKYFKRREDLMAAASESEKQIIRTFHKIKSEGTVRFDEMSEELFLWCRKNLTA